MKFPICIPIALFMGLTHHILFVSNGDIKANHFYKKDIEKLTSLEKEHLFIFASPTNDPRTLHFFEFEKWNAYSYTDKFFYTPLKVKNQTNINNLKYSIDTGIGKITYTFNCKISNDEKRNYEIVCKYKNENASSVSEYGYTYKYELTNDLQVKMKEVYHSESEENSKKANLIQPDTWIEFIFYGILTQYLFIPVFLRSKIALKRMINKIRGIKNYEDLPIIRTRARNK